LTMYSHIMGHERQIEQLERARCADRVAHAYLFHGPEGVGKEIAARAFAAALNCTSDGEVPCGECTNCRKIAAGSHPDVRLLASEEELVERGIIEAEKRRSPSAQIRNEQLDELADLFRHKPYLGSWKIVIVVDAHKLNTFSQNRFLKTLEEPSSDSVIILISSQPELLLPTVRSRCQALAFGAVSRSSITEYLTSRFDLDPRRAAVLAAMAQGSLGRAVALVDGDFLDMRDILADALGSLDKSDVEQLLALAEEHGRDRASVLQVLEMMELWCRDLLLARLGVGGDLLVNLDCASRIEEDSRALSPRRLMRWTEEIKRIRVAMKVHLNPRLALESLFIYMRTA